MNLIQQGKQSVQQGMDHFLRNFSHVPEDKLNWKPAPTAKSALEVAAHTACHMARFASMLRDRRLPQPESLEALLEQWRQEEAAVASRGQMEEIFRLGASEVLAALDSLAEEDLAIVFDSGMGWTLPMARLVELPGWHITLHLGQIDYLQTCWGDLQIYV